VKTIYGSCISEKEKKLARALSSGAEKVTAGEMAGGAIVPSDGPATDYGGSLTLSVFMSCLVAASGGLIFGYDIGISGPVFKTKLLY
jgi:hypothetical protein